MKDITIRFIDVYNYLLDIKKVKNASDFADKIQISSSLMNEILKGRSNVGIKPIQSTVKLFSFLNLDWLIKGEGKMSKDFQFSETKEKYPNEEWAIETYGIPLIPVEAMAGYGTGETSVLELDCEKFIVPTFNGADYLIQVKGSSMYPKYNSGDIVACKNLSLTDVFFQWNKVYVLDTVQGALIKRLDIGKDDEHILIVSDNEKYKPFQLHKSEINAIAIVLGVIRLE
ncbi:S24 family peptidase [Flavobacterium facile]|uniref:S24 family peptidase n=1 Tax=Flavobacterium facile TaxID=2893174 RepID=UPI002E766E09|nr:S24 family peptidase [Flavobacterium sp. T-12]